MAFVGQPHGAIISAGRDGVAQPAMHWGRGGNGERTSTSSPFLAFPAGHGIVGGQRDKGVEAVLSALQWSSSQPVLELSLLGERLSPPLCFPARGCIPITGRLRTCWQRCKGDRGQGHCINKNLCANSWWFAREVEVFRISLRIGQDCFLQFLKGQIPAWRECSCSGETPACPGSTFPPPTK